MAPHVAAALQTAVALNPPSAGNKWTIPIVTGYQFTANEAVRVTHLGWYDTSDFATPDGFNMPHTVGLWRADGTLLATTTLNAGASGILEGNFRFNSVSQLNLTSGQSYVIAGTDGSALPFLRDGTEYLVNVAPANRTIDSSITITGSRVESSPTSALIFPTQTSSIDPGGPGGADFGPNFAFQDPPVPQTASIPSGDPLPLALTPDGGGALTIDLPNSTGGEFSALFQEASFSEINGGGVAEFEAIDFVIPGSNFQFWTLEFTGSFDTGAGATVQFSYDPTAIFPGFDESLLAIYHYKNGQWTLQPGIVDPINNTITVTGINSFSDWGLGALTEPSGDYNQDGTVDAADYVVWRKTGINGTTGYDTWRTNFGEPAGSGSVAAANAVIPEPATLMILIVAAVGIGMRRRQKVPSTRQSVKRFINPPFFKTHKLCAFS